MLNISKLVIARYNRVHLAPVEYCPLNWISVHGTVWDPTMCAKYSNIDTYAIGDHS